MHYLVVFPTVLALILSLYTKCVANNPQNCNQNLKNLFNSPLICETNQTIHKSMNANTGQQMIPDLSVQLITWNVKSEQCKCDLTQLLDIDADRLTTGAGDQPLADIYAIGLQEVAFRPTALLFTDPWVVAFDRVFKQLDYVRLKQIRLVGILLIVYTKRHKLPHFRSIETQYTRTGFGGLWGNKGGVSVSLIMDGISLCIVNTHLAPHYENLEQRITDYNTITDGQYFWSNKKPNILSHDYVLWMGDLNFRIDDLTGDEIHDIILNAPQTQRSDNSVNSFAQLLAKDQLNRVRHEGLAFSEFSETEPTFAPTYKFFVNTDNYDYKSRKPAYTDRVLYRFTVNAYDNLKLDLKQLNYKSHPQYKQSDHKPVSSLFHLKTKESLQRVLRKRMAPLGEFDSQELDAGVDGGDQQIYVTFHPITDWKVNRDSTAWYTITPNNRNAIDSMSPWDWIGLFKSDFLSTDELLSYVWANPVPSRWSPPDSSDNSTQNADNESAGTSDTENAEPWFSVQYSDQTLLIADQFRLVYVTQNGDVLGISEPFLITN